MSKIMSKITLGLDDLKVLAQRAKAAGTEDRFIDLMLEWAEAAAATIEAECEACRQKRSAKS
jgi:hypothetical protein